MIPRKRLDIGWTDLLFGLGFCLWPGGREEMRHRLERLWSPEGHGLACLSVRSGFDAPLSVLDLPRGSEVLVSAITIRDMTRILEEHGLVAVPVDLDMRTLAVDQRRSAWHLSGADVSSVRRRFGEDSIPYKLEAQTFHKRTLQGIELLAPEPEEIRQVA